MLPPILLRQQDSRLRLDLPSIRRVKQVETEMKNIFPDPALNPALTMLSRRSELAQEAEAEFARVRYGGDSEGGRRFLDVVKIREVLVMRDERKMSEREIERRLGLQAGLVARLGGKDVVREAGLGDTRGAGEL
ncbi:MAG: hypothetical protein Q9185_006894 [Variospora sp. 1 TL-2023]